MPSMLVSASASVPDLRFQLFAQAARQLKSLDWCARTSQGPQSTAVKQQIDAVWRHILSGAANLAEANWRAAAVAGLMLGAVIMPDDLDQARRQRSGLKEADPFPIAAASVYHLLDAIALQEHTRAMEDAFAGMKVNAAPTLEDVFAGMHVYAAPWPPRPPTPRPPPRTR